ncbi:MAG: c-type cytochrome [Paracoccaceae bacterium]
MKTFLIAAAALALSTSAGFAASDADQGEADFKRCRSCHAVVDGDEVLVKGGKTGPNLFGIIGRTAGTYEGFNFSKDMLAAGEAGLVWDEAKIAEYLPDPKGFLATTLGKGSASSKMTPQRLKDPTDVVAFLASFAPMEAADAETETPEPQAEPETDTTNSEEKASE